jgi:GDP-L-fucose synthase
MPRRELMCSDDLAAATLHVMALDEAGFAHAFPDPRLPMINVGTGSDITIRELAYSVREVVGFSGEIVWDPAQPDGTPRKLLDVSRISATGWRARVPLKDGIRAAYDDFLSREGAGHISDPAARQWAHSGTT